ncbi:putative oxidoreductase [Podospora aff. communis PSN243]|uniref:Oxidoreductase n=1 Tax=Podospora aff. communis PSN243 TaxID=3040156 RepID=A0AAV9G285_9PEZI|nr:putative oxidoreductase [Podospora aff. communis PSN243]
MEQIVIASNATEAHSLSGACCLALLSALGNTKVSFPGTAAYNASQASYFAAQQSEATPLCVVSPASTEDVVEVIKSLVGTSGSLEHPEQRAVCRFAVRSGGHSSVPGAVNSDGGVTVDLRALNGVEFAGEDKDVVKIGVGARWGAVYRYLEEFGLSVTGGRVSDVGVGGLTLGGGISFFSPRYGWACDSVVNFEVVLADGAVVNANEDENRDLLVALRGGSGNFGIVTRVDMRTFEQGEFRGGGGFYGIETIGEHLKAFEEITQPEGYEEYLSQIFSFGYAGGLGSYVFQSMVYTKAELEPKAWAKVDAIPALQSTVRLDKMSGFAEEMNAFNPSGKRQFWLQTTFQSTPAMHNATFTHCEASKPELEHVEDVVVSLSLHPVPPSFYKNKQSTGNSLGLSSREGTLIIAGLTISWKNKEDDELVHKTGKAIMEAIEKDAKKMGAGDEYLYLNYVGASQDPITSYGSETDKVLRAVKKRVDPDGVFSQGSCGGFKLKA